MFQTCASVIVKKEFVIIKNNVRQYTKYLMESDNGFVSLADIQSLMHCITEAAPVHAP